MKTVLTIGSLVLTLAITLPSNAHTEVYTSLLAPEGVISSGTGTARLTFDLDLLTMRVQADYSGLSSNVTASHIHCCQAVAESGNVSVVTTTPTFPAFPSGTSGSYDMTFDMNLASSWNGNGTFVNANGGTTGAFNALYAAVVAHKAYLNIHTVNNGGGEIRAGRFNLVPEPGSLAIAVLAAGCISGACRRRR